MFATFLHMNFHALGFNNSGFSLLGISNINYLGQNFGILTTPTVAAVLSEEYACQFPGAFVENSNLLSDHLDRHFLVDDLMSSGTTN